MKPELLRRAEFETVLKDYSVSEVGLGILQSLDLLVLTSPTSAGRNTLIEKLVETGKYEAVVSDTTRPMRKKDGRVIETDGVEYFFRSEDDILADLRAGLFIEAALIHNQQVSGTSIRELAKAQKDGKTPILEIQQDGVHVIAREKPDTTFIFVLPPSFDEWMRRLKNRSDMSEDEIQNRLKSSIFEFTDALTQDYYHFVINDDIEKTIENIRSIAENGVVDAEDQQRSRQLTQQLLTEAQAHIV